MEITPKLLREQSKEHILKNEIVKDTYERVLGLMLAHARESGRTDYNFFLNDIDLPTDFSLNNQYHWNERIITELVIRLLEIDGFTVNRHYESDDLFINIGW